MHANDRDNDKIATITGNANVHEPADFDKAISTTGYGLFNVLLLLAALPIAWTAVFDTTTGAFIIPSAECELELTFFRKGVLVAFPYVAMTTTSFIWDYITPYASVKTLFILALLGDSILNIVSSSIQSYYVFLLVKFVSGVLESRETRERSVSFFRDSRGLLPRRSLSRPPFPCLAISQPDIRCVTRASMIYSAGGPLAMVMTYLTEFHSARYKPRFATWAGFLFAVANIVPAALGFAILPLDWHIDIFGQSYNSWRIYLLICSIPPVIGLVTSVVLPDSPKYLMSIGRSDAALRLLRRMYHMNTGQPPETFPIKALVPQKKLLTRPVLEVSLEKMRVSLYNTKLLLSTTYLPAFCFVSFLQFGSMLGFNTMRLWVPQMFIILNNFDADNWTPHTRHPTICEMLDRHAALPGRRYLNSSNFDDACFEWTINPVVYQNSTIIASSAVVFSFLAGFLMNTKLRKQIIILMAFLISVASSFGINWAQSPPYMLTLAAAVIVTTRIAGNVVTAVNVDVIPIPLRASSSSVLTTIGNIGAIVGNFIFSALLGTKCIGAFTGLGCLFTVCFCLSLFFPQPVRDSPKKFAQENTTKV